MNGNVHSLPLIRAGIDTYRRPVVYMREDCHLCRAEGFSALTQVEIVLGGRSIVAIPHCTNAISLAGMLAETLADLRSDGPGATLKDKVKS